MVKKAFYLKGDQYLDNNTQRKPNTTIYLLACKNGIRHLERTLHMTNPTFPIYLHENELQEIASGQNVTFYKEHKIPFLLLMELTNFDIFFCTFECPRSFLWKAFLFLIMKTHSK